jgi:hypothetical protein
MRINWEFFNNWIRDGVRSSHAFCVHASFIFFFNSMISNPQKEKKKCAEESKKKSE